MNKVTFLILKSNKRIRHGCSKSFNQLRKHLLLKSLPTSLLYRQYRKVLEKIQLRNAYLGSKLFTKDLYFFKEIKNICMFLYFYLPILLLNYHSEGCCDMNIISILIKIFATYMCIMFVKNEKDNFKVVLNYDLL